MNAGDEDMEYEDEYEKYNEDEEERQMNTADEDGEERLRPCPFCGSSDVAVHRPYACPKCGERNGAFYVMCNDCGGSTGVYVNEEDAVHRWNGPEE